MYKVLLTQKGDLGHLQLSKRVAIFHSLFDSSFNSVKKFLSISICLLQQIFYFPFSQSQQLLHLSPSTPTDMWVPHVIPFLSLLVPLRRCHHKSRCARDDGGSAVRQHRRWHKMPGAAWDGTQHRHETSVATSAANASGGRGPKLRPEWREGVVAASGQAAGVARSGGPSSGRSGARGA